MTTVIDEANTKVDNWREAEETDRATARHEAWCRYTALLIRSEDPKPGDADELAQLLADLDISASRAKDDATIVRRALNFLLLDEERATANRAYQEAARTYRAVRDRHEVEGRAAHRERAAAEDYHRRCACAGGELLLLKRTRPELFDDSENPIRLLSLPATADEASAKARMKKSGK